MRGVVTSLDQHRLRRARELDRKIRWALSAPTGPERSERFGAIPRRAQQRFWDQLRHDVDCRTLDAAG